MGDGLHLIGVNLPGKSHVGKPVARTEEFEFDPLPREVIPDDIKRLQAYILVAGDMEGASKPPAVDATVLADDCSLRSDHPAESIHETDGVAACKHHLDTGIYENPERLDGRGADTPTMVGDGAVDIGYERLQHDLSPACSTMNAASPSGRFGLSTRRATLFPPLPLRR